MQFLKPAFVIQKDYAKKTQTSFSSTVDEWKSATMMGKADRKTNTGKARNLTENMKFEKCCISVSSVYPF